MKNTLRKITQRLLNLFILGVGIGSLLGFLGRLDWRLELFSHFRVQYLALHLIAFLIAVGIKNSRSILLSGGFVIFHLWFILPFYLPTKPTAEIDTEYRILLSNVLTENTSYDKVQDLIQTTNPDIILLLETSQTWLNALSLEEEGYSYAITAPRDDNFGIALYSRLPINESRIVDFGGGEYFSIVASIQFDSQELTIIGTHPPPPVGDGATRRRNRQLLEVAEFVANQTGSIMVLGDLNITTWSPFFEDTIGNTNLRDSRLGFGIQPTWSTERPFFLRIPIDHIFVSETVTVVHREIGPEIGSDHLPVILDFTIP